ncbi:glycosyl transferase family protein [Novosphingobium sp.]|uniref:glycosyl transferase family protein n=1 Tax=Novosphingobium sp. TaxID=1874826 RepID=UPI001DE3472E|nr:glycosyl transferase family protein [Novosphingobium sp.]MBX9663764.1 glycosyl transferase family protein [Novosphingobium sp.]
MTPFYTALEWLGRAEHELLLFAAIWFAVGCLDEFGIDVLWLWLRLTGRVHTGKAPADCDAPLRGVAAVLVPAWQEAAVVGAMLTHTLKVWPQKELRVYAGCYRNDPGTLTAMVAAAHDPRLRIVVHDCAGPTTKADCLNRLYAALVEDEKRGGFRARSVVLHDAEDMVHPAALSLLDRGLDDADFVQLPVRPEPQSGSRWIAGHYCDEFAESHGKAMVVRDWLGVGLPSAGVGCAFSRAAVEAIAARRGMEEPFAAECLTEDYECGLLVGQIGGAARFVRMRDAEGHLVATREFFPAGLGSSVRQKTRWMHGIAFQGWDRLGWDARPLELWMRLRDRRAPLTAIVLAAAYLLLIISPVLYIASQLGAYRPHPIDPLLKVLLIANFVGLAWRCLFRAVFTAHEYSLGEGIMAVLRMPLANVIAIMAGRRALAAYVVSLYSGRVKWDHTIHMSHPALAPVR